MSKLIYCATPSRLVNKDPQVLERIMDFVSDQGYGPLHPFQALPYKRFEGNPRFGDGARNFTMDCCLRLLNISDELWMFGVSDGTLIEARQAISMGRPIKLHLDDFDPEWKSVYGDLKEEHGDPLKKLLV